MSEADSQRLDTWLWAARFYKTRSLAKREIDGGKVQLNGANCKPSRAVRAGDLLKIRKARQTFIIEVLGLTASRGPARVAETLYQETPDSIESRQRDRDLARAARLSQPIPEGKPDRRDQRALQRFKRGG